MDDAEREVKSCRRSMELAVGIDLSSAISGQLAKAQVLECLCRRAIGGDESAMSYVVEELERRAA